MRMKQKMRTSRLPVCRGLFVLLILIPQLLLAQEQVDSIRIPHDSVPRLDGVVLQLSPSRLLPRKVPVYPVYSPSQPVSLRDFSLRERMDLPYQVNPGLLFRGDYRTGGVMHQFAHGTLFGSGGQTSLAGIGVINNASLGYQHLFNERLELELRANAMKVNMTHFTGQAFSTSGTLLYHASDRVAFKLFGSYDIGNSYGMSTHSYGATVSIDMSSRFGMEMGVQRYYDAMRGRWETVPVVIPYYRFEKFTLGMDVGGILYEVLRSTVFDKRGGGGGPTIAPPRFSLPIR